MKKQSKNNNCTNSLVSEPSETDVNNNQLENEEVLQNITIDQVADELNRISQLDTILDNYFENHTSDDLNNELNYNEPEDLLEINITEAESFIKKTEIDYIINNQDQIFHKNLWIMSLKKKYLEIMEVVTYF